jgi:hypothetical protein
VRLLKVLRSFGVGCWLNQRIRCTASGTPPGFIIIMLPIPPGL